MAGRIQVPDDFNAMGSTEIDTLFYRGDDKNTSL